MRVVVTFIAGLVAIPICVLVVVAQVCAWPFLTIHEIGDALLGGWLFPIRKKDAP